MKFKKIFLISFSDLIFILVFFATFLIKPCLDSYDVFWHIKTGEVILQGNLPDHDIFSFTASRSEWILHEWLSQVIFALIYRHAGARGLLILRALIFGLIFFILFRIFLKSGKSLLISLLFTIMGFLTCGKLLSMRPHIFTLLFFVLILYCHIDLINPKSKFKRGIYYIMPAIFLIWINFHGGFIIGIIFLIVTFMDFIISSIKATRLIEGIKKRSLIIILSILACFFNPFTYKAVFYPFMYAGNKAMPSYLISEWSKTNIANSPFYFIIVFIFILLLLFKKNKVEFPTTLICFVMLGFLHTRLTPFAGLVVLFILAFNFKFSEIGFLKKLQFLNFIIFKDKSLKKIELSLNNHFSLIILLIIATCFIYRTLKVESNLLPVECVKFLKKVQPPGNIFNQYKWGGYILLNITNKKVFIDGRMDIYRYSITKDYLIILNLKKSWHDLINKYKITHILVEKDTVIGRFLNKIDKDWIIIKSTNLARLFLHKSIYAKLINRLN